MTIWAGPIANYADRAAADVIDPTVYIRAGDRDRGRWMRHSSTPGGSRC